MKLSVLIPAQNEEDVLEHTVDHIASALQRENILFEVLLVDDNSTDTTPTLCDRLAEQHDWFRVLHRTERPGIGRALADGLNHFEGDAVAIMMADDSDDPEDLVIYYRELERGVDCVFGSRWMKGGRVIDYPWIKRIFNRLGNRMIQALFWLPYDDVTNAFKAYRREVIDGVRPLLSFHFNILAEIPLKAMVRGYSYRVVPISWRNRTTGVAKLKIKEMGSRYMFIILYVLLEKWLSRQDYHR